MVHALGLSFFEPQTEPRALFSLETCLRKSHKAPLRNSPLHTDSAQKIVPTLPNMNRVRRQKLRPKILRPDNGPAHFPVRPCERRRGHRSQRGMRPGKKLNHRGAGRKKSSLRKWVVSLEFKSIRSETWHS